jgi:chemosensory pili system protein ChpA (sensor histidine kinase/response regulator)
LRLAAGKSLHSEIASPMLLLSNGDEEVAVIVDSIVGSQDIVVKSLGNHLQKIPGIVGATIGGDGCVIPILDTADLINQDSTNVLDFAEYQTSSSSSQRPTMAMVIDDSISVRRVTENLLSSAGWEVVTAKDGVDALEKLVELDSAPDVFLCDMEMPRMDGLELVRQLREQQEFELTPIVMVTSRASEKHRHKAFDAGATDYVVKPFNDEKLLDLISTLVQRSRETVTS